MAEAYGFDTKYCGHMVRLGLQGVELMETGRISLPVPEPWRTWIRDLRVGKHTMAEALEVAADSERRLLRLTSDSPLASEAAASPLPFKPNHAGADRWLVATYQRAWTG